MCFVVVLSFRSVYFSLFVCWACEWKSARNENKMLTFGEFSAKEGGAMLFTRFLVRERDRENPCFYLSFVLRRKVINSKTTEWEPFGCFIFVEHRKTQGPMIRIAIHIYKRNQTVLINFERSVCSQQRSLEHQVIEQISKCWKCKSNNICIKFESKISHCKHYIVETASKFMLRNIRSCTQLCLFTADNDTWKCECVFSHFSCVLFFASHFACRSYFACDNAKRKGPFGDIAMVVHNGCACIENTLCMTVIEAVFRHLHKRYSKPSKNYVSHMLLSVDSRLHGYLWLDF